MIALIIAGLVLGVVLAAAFLATYGPPGHWSDAGMGWHIATSIAAVAALVALLLLAMLGVRIPAWIGAVAVYGLDAALARWLWLAIKARRRSGR